ncbi:DUF2490 domain-containing protein [Flammeovirga sp. EKP202]|uniref:DUF2490 domain-containing protein n=1 Tax=Flammeovirga sp. EKP202 TaxID=2770592 RepID=UPI00165F9EE8|nr:DUF2490 domain-containing protein [Flammeovirga sp. EKP202]MBD0405322.1 DUF2490 domain-containing protein [Flammeovirga sp. EKP202]
MKPRIISLTILLTFLKLTVSYGQDQIAWFHYFNKMNLSYKFSIDTDLGYRSDFEGMERWQIRSGLKYDIIENVSVRAGVMHVQGTQSASELRFYQDLMHKEDFSSFTFSLRVRFEEQYFPQLDQTNYRVRYNPMIKFSTSAGLISLGCEPFINLDSFQVTNNRWYFGITRYAFKNTLITLQYIKENSYSNTEIDRFNSPHMIRIKIDHSINPIRIRR